MSEHIFVPLAGGTAVRCSCGKEYNTTAEAQQHQWWELQLQIASQYPLAQRIEVNPNSHTYSNPKKGNTAK